MALAARHHETRSDSADVAAVLTMPRPKADDRELPPWLTLAPGKRGLPNAVLRHLIDARYSAVVAGAGVWAMRSTSDVFSAAGTGLGMTVHDTEDALVLLQAHGLVQAIRDGADRSTRWSVTDAGASAVELRNGPGFP